MATPIIMPKFGQMTEESAIVEWLKKEGDQVAKGDILFTVETDKSVMEVESFEEGTLLKIAVQPGVSVPVQSTVGFLGQPGEAVPDDGCACAGCRRTQETARSPARRLRRQHVQFPPLPPSPVQPSITPTIQAPAAPARVPHQPPRGGAGARLRH